MTTPAPGVDVVYVDGDAQTAEAEKDAQSLPVTPPAAPSGPGA